MGRPEKASRETAMQKKKTLTNEELAGRILALEALAVTALGTAMLGHGLLSKPQKAVDLLNSAKGIVRRRAADPAERISQQGEAEAFAYLDHVLSNFSEQVIQSAREAPKKADDKD
jgi:hypothetical protein